MMRYVFGLLALVGCTSVADVETEETDTAIDTDVEDTDVEGCQGTARAIDINDVHRPVTDGTAVANVQNEWADGVIPNGGTICSIVCGAGVEVVAVEDGVGSPYAGPPWEYLWNGAVIRLSWPAELAATSTSCRVEMPGEVTTFGVYLE